MKDDFVLSEKYQVVITILAIIWIIGMFTVGWIAGVIGFIVLSVMVGHRESIINKNRIAEQESMQKNLDIIEESMRQTAEHISTVLALANLGAEKYGNPTITYGGKKYNSTMVLKAFEDRVQLKLDEITICKMMYFKLKDHVEQLRPVDEHGNHIRSEDETLNKYLSFAMGHVKRLERLLEKTSHND